MLRYGPSASFLSAGGYHHHLGVNTWAGLGAPAPPQDAVGLQWFVIRLPDRPTLAAVIDQVQQNGFSLQETESGLFGHDPSGNGILLTSPSSPDVIG